MANAPKLILGVSGPICAGKTTTARFLERRGFAYSRFSLVIDDEIARRGLPLNRETRQAVGWDIHENLGQTRLAERVLGRVSGSDLIVIDGLRFAEDRRFFVGRFGSAFLHLHIEADRELRRERYQIGEKPTTSFVEAEAAEVEAEVSSLAGLAAEILINDASFDDLYGMVGNYVDALTQGGEGCRSQ